MPGPGWVWRWAMPPSGKSTRSQRTTQAANGSSWTKREISAPSASNSSWSSCQTSAGPSTCGRAEARDSRRRGRRRRGCRRSSRRRSRSGRARASRVPQWKYCPPSMTIVCPVTNDAVGPREVGDGADDVLRVLVALDRPRRDRDVAQLLDHLRVLLHAVGHREPGGDAVDADAVPADLLRERARERDDRPLARHVVEQERDAAERRARGDVDDRPSTPLAHGRHGGAAGQEHRRDVDVHHAPPLLERDLGERPHRERGVEPRVVDEHVEPAAALERLRDHPVDRGLVGDVDGQADAARVGRGSRVGALQVGDDDPRALRRERRRRSPFRSPARRP